MSKRTTNVMKLLSAFLGVHLWLLAPAFSQTYDLLLKSGHVIDPATDTDRVLDVAVTGNKIARVAQDIPAGQAKKVVDATGLYVSPGLVDLHMHVYTHARESTLFPDSVALIAGTTTVCDAGTSGWRTFEDFKASIIDKSATRVLSFLNIVGQGMRDGSQGESNEQDMDPAATSAKVKQYPNIIVGVKTAHYRNPGFTALKPALEAGRLAGLPGRHLRKGQAVSEHRRGRQDRPRSQPRLYRAEARRGGRPPGGRPGARRQHH